jgi:uncharacterized membrane protein YbhN (UPF0104 family)
VTHQRTIVPDDDDREHDPSSPSGETDSAVEQDEAAVKRSQTPYRVLAVCFSLIIFAASAWYIGRTFQWGQLGQVLGQVNLLFLIVGGGGSLVGYWVLRTLRWRILLRRTDTHVPLMDLYLCTAVSLSFALFTPLQSGEVLKVELLKKYGMLERFPGYGSFLVERALDMAVLLSVGCFSLLTTLDILPNRTYAYCVLGGLALFCVVGLLALAKLRLRGRPQQLLMTMRQCIGDTRTLILVAGITCVSWASVAFSWQVFLYSAGINIGFVNALALMSVVSLISIASLIPGGVGISEVGSSTILMRFGLAASTAQAGAIVLRSLSLVAIGLGAGHLGVWKLVRLRRSRRLEAGAADTESAAEDNSPTS